MKTITTVLAGGCVLAAVLAMTSEPATAQYALKGKTQGHCELSNVAAGVVLYSGNCTIKETIDGSSTRFAVKMGEAQSFLFATSDGKHWMHGPDKVKFRDRGDSGVFKWDDFRLVVHED